MPHTHIPGARARLKTTALKTVAATDPATLQHPINNRSSRSGHPNVSAIARALSTTPATLSRMVHGALPVNLELVVAHVARRGSWAAAAELVDVVRPDGTPVPLAACPSCTHEKAGV